MLRSKFIIIVLFGVLINLLSQSHAIEEHFCDSQQVLPSHFVINSLEVANDESYMIFTLDTDGLARDTLLYNFETEETRNLSPDEYINRFNNTQLTSDSQYLVYTTRRQGDQQGYLFSMTIATGESRQLSLPYEVGIDHTDIRYIISPDNESVMYAITDASSPVVNTLYVADITGEETIEIMPDVEFLCR